MVINSFCELKIIATIIHVIQHKKKKNMIKNKNKQEERKDISSTSFFFFFNSQIGNVNSVNCFFLRRNFYLLERQEHTSTFVVLGHSYPSSGGA